MLIYIYAHVMYTNEVLIFYRIHKNSNRELIYIACKSFNLINTHLHILNLDTLIYLRELGDLAKSNLVIQLPAILSRMPLAKANLLNMLGFIYFEHDIYYNYIHLKNFKLYKCT